MPHDDAPHALYEQLAQDLRSKIVDGTYAVGDALPSMNTLMRDNGVSVTVVRDALKILKGESLVVGQPGKAVWVARVPAEDTDEVSEQSVAAEIRGLRDQLRDINERLVRVEQHVDEAPTSERPS